MGRIETVANTCDKIGNYMRTNECKRIKLIDNVVPDGLENKAVLGGACTIEDNGLCLIDVGGNITIYCGNEDVYKDESNLPKIFSRISAVEVDLSSLSGKKDIIIPSTFEYSHIGTAKMPDFSSTTSCYIARMFHSSTVDDVTIRGIKDYRRRQQGPLDDLFAGCNAGSVRMQNINMNKCNIFRTFYNSTIDQLSIEESVIGSKERVYIDSMFDWATIDKLRIEKCNINVKELHSFGFCDIKEVNIKDSTFSINLIGSDTYKIGKIVLSNVKIMLNELNWVLQSCNVDEVVSDDPRAENIVDEIEKSLKRRIKCTIEQRQ